MRDEEEEYDFEYSDDDEAEPDVEIENAYYAAKGDKESDPEAALRGFLQVVALEAERGQRGEWGFKALNQCVQLLFALGRHEEMLARYVELLDYATAPSTSTGASAAVAAVTQNVAEKGIDSILDHVSQTDNLPLLHRLYDTTLARLDGTAGSGATSLSSSTTSTTDPPALKRPRGDGAGRVKRNERLWFKTNLKLGHLLLRDVAAAFSDDGAAGAVAAQGGGKGMVDDNDNDAAAAQSSLSISGSGGPSAASAALGRLQRVVRELLRCCEQSPASGGGGGDGSGGMGDGDMGADTIKRGTQLLEVYALQMQLHSLRRDSRRLKELYQQALRVTWGVPHPRTLGLMQECGGKMYMGERDYDHAIQSFFQSFKSYDEAGDPRRLTVLKYLVLASMLGQSRIDPFDSQEARAYKEEREVAAVRRLIEAYKSNDVAGFERILQAHRASIMGDDFIRSHIGDLLRTVRTQALLKALAPYDRVALPHLAKELNGVPEAEVESLLVSLILDGHVRGYIDQLRRYFVKGDHCPPSPSSQSPRRYVPSVTSNSSISSSTMAHPSSFFWKRGGGRGGNGPFQPPPPPPQPTPTAAAAAGGTDLGILAAAAAVGGGGAGAGGEGGRKELFYRAVRRLAEALADVGGAGGSLGARAPSSFGVGWGLR